MKKSFGQILTDAMALEYENVKRQIESEKIQRPFTQIVTETYTIIFPLN